MAISTLRRLALLSVISGAMPKARAGEPSFCAGRTTCAVIQAFGRISSVTLRENSVSAPRVPRVSFQTTSVVSASTSSEPAKGALTFTFTVSPVLYICLSVVTSAMSGKEELPPPSAP